MKPASVAVVGASPREDSTGFLVLQNLAALGYPGAVFPVNPRHAEIAGHRCYPSLSALPERPDVAFLAVPAAAGPAVVAEAGACGIRAAVVNASGYADGGPEGQALEARLVAAARRHGMAVCGPNNMGLINVHDRTALWMSRRFPDVRPGPLAVISQSGSVAIALHQDTRKLGLAYVISTGNEAVLTAADYLDHVGADERVRVVALLLETIRDPRAFAAAAERTVRRGARIVALKVGRSEQGGAAVSAHTGAIAGDERMYEAFFRRHGIVAVSDLDELLETCALFAAYPEPPAQAGVVLVTLSGGEAALLADVAADAGVPLAPLDGETTVRLAPLFPPFASPRNPLDAWGLGWDADRVARMLDIVSTAAGVGAIAIAVDTTPAGGGDTGLAQTMATLCLRRAPGAARVVFFSNLSSGVNDDLHATLRGAGIPYLAGIRAALAALAALARWVPALGAPAPDDGDAGPDVSVEPLTPGPFLASLSEPERFDLVRRLGVPMVRCETVASVDAALRAAAALGGAVALKASGPALAHKSDEDLVRLNLDRPQAIEAAFVDLRRRLEKLGLQAEVVIQPMVPPGIELIVGVRNDPGFGTLLVVGLGGLHVETFGDVSVRLAPVAQAEAVAMLRETRAGRLLAGLRGKGPFDIEAAACAVVALGRLGVATRTAVAAIEVNPLIVLAEGQGAIGVDVLIEPVARG